MPPVKIIGPGEGKIVWAAGDHYTFKVTGQDTGGTYSLFEGLVPPQAGPPLHFHQREFEAFYILEGNLTFHTRESSVTRSENSPELRNPVGESGRTMVRARSCWAFDIS